MTNDFREVVTGTDVRIERILKRAGWPMKRLGEPRRMGGTIAIAGLLPANQISFERVRPANYVSVFQSLRHAA